MNGLTKKDQIRSLKAHNPGMEAGKIAEELNCSRDYVYEVWEPDADPAEYPEPGTARTGSIEDTDMTDGSAGIEPDDLADAAADAAADGDTDNPLADLVIDDEWEEYECGECGAEVEYLDDECAECGNGLAWWRGA